MSECVILITSILTVLGVYLNTTLNDANLISLLVKLLSVTIQQKY